MSSLIASASPNGRVRIQPGFPIDEELIESPEAAHREVLSDEDDEAEWRWQNQVRRLTNASEAGFEPEELAFRRVSSRQAVIAELGELVRRNGRGASLESRSHELHKSRLRLTRRGR